MIHLSPNEKILKVLHRHWIALLGKVVAVLVLATLVPLLLFYLFSLVNISMNIDALAPFVLFFFVIYLMIITLFFYVSWVDYYLDIWVVTSERIIDINQIGLFRREITEFRLDKVQDITVEVPDMMATFLKYGDLILETAGESTFKITQIPNVYEAKNLILDLTSSDTKNVGTQQVGTD